MRKPLTFEMLDVEVEAYVAATDDGPAPPAERWLFAIGLFAAGVGSLVATLVGGVVGLWIIWGSLLVEMIGLLGSFVLQVVRNWKAIRQSKRDYARELDHDYGEAARVISFLVQWSPTELHRALRYVRRRKAALIYRLGLMTGGVERLGALPVLVALYIQFKDWEFGDWAALGEINLLGGLLLWALLLIYLGSWYLIRLRLRLDVYEFLLDEAYRVHPDVRTI